MKTKITILAMVATLAMMISCRSASNRSMLGDNTKDYVTEGWLNKDTFQVRAIGAPNPDSKGKVRRMTQAKEAALLAAQKRVIELLVGATISGASGSDSGESTGVAITKEFEGVIKGGAIVKTSYDEELNAEITYRIHAKGLKKQASSMAKKSDFRE